MTQVTTQVVQFVLLGSSWPGGAHVLTGSVAPRLQTVPEDRSSVVLAVVLVVVAVLAAGWALYARAVRVDRLHRQVLGARATLEAQILHRAEAAADLASTGVLDPASCLLLARAARDALDAEGPVIHDGLDPVPRLDAVPVRSSVRLGTAAAAADAGGTEPAPLERPAPAWEEAGTRSRSQVESDLSRVLRAVLSQSARAELAASPQAAAALERLDKACYRMVLARRFHNTHVAEAQALRRRPVVRVLHLAGHAPMPQTFEVDDDTAPLRLPEQEGAEKAAGPQ